MFLKQWSVEICSVFLKIKENENPKKRFEQQTLFGVYAHVEVHTTHFLLNMQSGSLQSYLRDSGFFSLVLNGGKKQMHHDRDIDQPIGLLHFAELPQFLDTLHKLEELVVASHTAMYRICGTTTVFCTSF